MTPDEIMKLADEAYPPFAIGGTDNLYVTAKKKAAYVAGYTACEKEREAVIWSMIEDFQDMMREEGLDRDTEINNKHLSYNDVEAYLYDLLPSPPKKQP